MLAVAWIAVAVAVGADWFARWRHDAGLENVTKPAATIAIATVALVVADDAPTVAIGAAIVAFACCLAGDVALLPSVDRFVIGLASFLVGHIAFVVMFAAIGFESVLLAVVATTAMAALGGTLGVRIVRGASTADAGLAVPVMAYLGVISTMTVAGWATGGTAAIAGATLFVTSDTILGWRAFVAERRWMSLAVMITYHGALVGLAVSLA